MTFINFRLRLYLDSKSQSYERSVYSFLTFSGDLGGVFAVLQVIGTFIIIANAKLLMYDILSNLYQVDETPKGEGIDSSKVISKSSSPEGTSKLGLFKTLKTSVATENNAQTNDGVEPSNILSQALKKLKSIKPFRYTSKDV